jgi:hypothetical protein
VSPQQRLLPGRVFDTPFFGGEFLEGLAQPLRVP